jgi:D-arabinose 5-phosphate isomerase GutQ
MSNFIVELHSPTKSIIKNINENLFDRASKTGKSIQPMSTLFDQALHIYGDIVSLGIIDKLKINKKKLWKYHANLE